MLREDPFQESEAEFLKSYDASRYPRPSVTVDMVIFTILDKPQDNYRKLPERELNVLLIKRGGHPYLGCWALPGGFVREKESLEDAAVRELQEETGLKNIYMEQLYTWGDPDRDPRTRVISCAYMALTDAENLKLSAGDDALEAKWFALDKKLLSESNLGETKIQEHLLSFTSTGFSCKTLLEKTISRTGKMEKTHERIREPEKREGIAFDHARIISYALDRLRNKIDYTDIVFNLMPEFFTLTQLQQVYETILGKELLKANFRRKIEHKLIETDQFTEAGHRPSRLFKYRES